MDNNEDKINASNAPTEDIESRGAVNSLILDYYKKFGKKRDLEQFFSLSTAQSDIRDTSGLFWRKMKSENDSSDSGEQRSSTADHELCRISIRCSVPDPSSSQSDAKPESPHTTSPPIITEESQGDISQQTDDESLKSDDNHSQKSFDPLLDLSSHKPLSPTSSVTSQRKLEWDSLADVGYAYESERKTSGSTLSTLERLALKQQFSNNDSKQDIGSPTCHSTPLDENDNKSKIKKSSGKTTKITKKDFDYVELNLPQTSDAKASQSIQVNLTKHISFHVEKDGEVVVDNIRKDVNVSPEKITNETIKTSSLPTDKEIQTSLLKTNDKSVGSIELNKPVDLNSQKIPVMISLNTLRKKIRKKKSNALRRKIKKKRKIHKSQDKTSHEKSGGQLSEAESFEYMPGHIYNQNQLIARDVNKTKSNNNTTTGNKSSLESSTGLTTDSSKGSKHSFSKDLEKCIQVLKLTLQKKYDDNEIKKKLIKEIIQRLLNSKYRDDDTSTDFLSGLSINSRNHDFKGNTTSSTSDANNTDNNKRERPRKSILRMEKFDSKFVASTSQSVPNLSTAAGSAGITNLQEKLPSNSGSNESGRWKTSTENAIPKTSSEELYLRYLAALKREESYKRQLKDKERYLKQRLVSSETALKASANQEPDINNRVKQLMKDLTRNNYDNGSGDASKLETGSISDRNGENIQPVKNQRSHSVFTLSSNHSDSQKKLNIKKNMKSNRDIVASTSQNHYCCCPHHSVNSKALYSDSSVQVNLQFQYDEESNKKLKQDFNTKCQKCNGDIMPVDPKNLNTAIQSQCNVCQCHTNICKNDGAVNNFPNSRQPSKHTICPDVRNQNVGEIYLCKDKQRYTKDKDNVRVYECKLINHATGDPSNVINTHSSCVGPCEVTSGVDEIQLLRAPCNLDNFSTSTNSNCYSRRHCKSSQTNLLTKMLCTKDFENYSQPSRCVSSVQCAVGSEIGKRKTIIHEATRCLQTEISIDPKISDPSLSNIIITNQCAELIGQTTREVIINAIEEMKTFSDVYTSSDSGKILLNSEDGFYQSEIKESDINIIESKDSNKTCTKIMPKDYAIPIKGTNMTLMVSLASSETMQSKLKINQQVGTEKALIKEEGTCISEECAKSVQCECRPQKIILKNDRTVLSDCNSNRSSKQTSPKKYCQSNPSPTRSPQRNTYPKIVKIKENKPLRRSNTDTGKLKGCCELKKQVLDINTDRLTRCTKEIGIQKDFSGDESHKKHTALMHLESRSVGTDISSRIEQGLGVSCQTDFEVMHSDNTQQKTSNVAAENTGGTFESQCSVKMPCGCINVCQCDSVEIDQKSILKNSATSELELQTKVFQDPIMTIIQDITRRYSKADITKCKKKKCFNEIVSILNYLLETEENSEQEPKCITPESSDNSKRSLGVKLNCCDKNAMKKPTKKTECCDQKSTHTDSVVRCEKSTKNSLRTSESESLQCKRDKSVQLSSKSTSKCTESSDIPCSTDRPSTSDSTACKIFNKIKKECEKYHMRRKCGRKCEISSSTSVNCDDCKKVHHCGCRHKCKRSKAVDKFQKKCLAYNLILQTSESMLSDETVCDNIRPLPSVVVKVPKRKDKFRTETCKETIYRIEKGLKCSPRAQRSKGCHKDSEVSSSDNFIRTQQCTVRQYLERNRPDFVEKSGERQNCLKFLNEIRANERAAHRGLLSMQVDKEPDLTTLTSEQLRDLATQIGLDIRKKKPAPKFMSEREMKRHSEDIYKTLPEVVQKKEDKKKENVKKTNLLMANIFKKNLQKKTLRGAVNLSNYSTVIKI